MHRIEVRPRQPEDDDYIRRSLIDFQAATAAAAHGELIDAMPLPGLVALLDGEPAGHLTYRPDESGWEVVTVVATRPGRGVGGGLMAALLDRARSAGVASVWLVTTNNNTTALRFYQRQGFDLIRLDRDAVTRSRQQLKPEIPVHADGIAIRHELVLEWRPGG